MSVKVTDHDGIDKRSEETGFKDRPNEMSDQ